MEPHHAVLLRGDTERVHAKARARERGDSSTQRQLSGKLCFHPPVALLGELFGLPDTNGQILTGIPETPLPVILP